MKYLVRAVKYYIYLLIVLALIIFALVSFNLVESDIESMFVHGYDSLWQMALIIAVFAIIYPRFGFTSRNIHMGGGEYSELRGVIASEMESRGYRLEREEGESLSYIRRSPIARAVKMWEDRLTFTRTIDGFSIEGISKDVARVVSAVEYRCSGPQE